MKRTVFLIDSEKKLQVEKYLNEKGITFSWDDRFHFDFRTAAVVGIVAVIVIILISVL